MCDYEREGEKEREREREGGREGEGERGREGGRDIHRYNCRLAIGQSCAGDPSGVQ